MSSDLGWILVFVLGFGVIVGILLGFIYLVLWYARRRQYDFEYWMKNKFFPWLSGRTRKAWEEVKKQKLYVGALTVFFILLVIQRFRFPNHFEREVGPLPVAIPIALVIEVALIAAILLVKKLQEMVHSRRTQQPADSGQRIDSLIQRTLKEVWRCRSALALLIPFALVRWRFAWISAKILFHRGAGETVYPIHLPSWWWVVIGLAFDLAIYWFVTNVLAPRNIWFTRLPPAYGKFAARGVSHKPRVVKWRGKEFEFPRVVEGGEPVRPLFHMKGLKLDDKWRVVPRPEDEPEPFRLFGGVEHISWLWPFVQIYGPVIFIWSNMNSDGIVVHHEPEAMDGLLVGRSDDYLFSLVEAEDSSQRKVIVDGMARVTVIAPYVAWFKPQNWLEATLHQVRSLVRTFCANFDYNNLTKKTLVTGADFFSAVARVELERKAEEEAKRTGQAKKAVTKKEVAARVKQYDEYFLEEFGVVISAVIFEDISLVKEEEREAIVDVRAAQLEEQAAKHRAGAITRRMKAYEGIDHWQPVVMALIDTVAGPFIERLFGRGRKKSRQKPKEPEEE